jgi:hypothetical protein
MLDITPAPSGNARLKPVNAVVANQSRLECGNRNLHVASKLMPFFHGAKNEVEKLHERHFFYFSDLLLVLVPDARYFDQVLRRTRGEYTFNGVPVEEVRLRECHALMSNVELTGRDPKSRKNKTAL